MLEGISIISLAFIHLIRDVVVCVCSVYAIVLGKIRMTRCYNAYGKHSYSRNLTTLSAEYTHTSEKENKPATK